MSFSTLPAGTPDPYILESQSAEERRVSELLRRQGPAAGSILSILFYIEQDSGAFENGHSTSYGTVAPHKRTPFPDDTYGWKSHIERRWGRTFINVAGLAR